MFVVHRAVNVQCRTFGVQDRYFSTLDNLLTHRDSLSSVEKTISAECLKVLNIVAFHTGHAHWTIFVRCFWSVHFLILDKNTRQCGALAGSYINGWIHSIWFDWFNCYFHSIDIAQPLQFVFIWVGKKMGFQNVNQAFLHWQKSNLWHTYFKAQGFH